MKGSEPAVEKKKKKEKEVLPGTLRQREYRKKHLKEGKDQRLQVILSPDAKLAMDRMATYYITTRKEILERLLLAAEDALLQSLADGQAALYRDASKVPKC